MVNDSQSLEGVLAELASSAMPPVVRQQYWHVPMYLQELLGEVSQHFCRAGTATRYHTLVNEVEITRVPQVVYVTLNYDLLLDTALSQIYQCAFADIGHYCESGRSWALVKLHGSVNWGRRVSNLVRFDQRPFAIQVRGDSIEMEDKVYVLANHQDARFENGVHYPVLAAPIADKHEFACPLDHVEFVKHAIADCTALLVIGVSGLDTHVLELFQHATALRGIAVVNGTKVRGHEFLGRFRPHLSKAGLSIDDSGGGVVFDGGFQSYANGPLREYLHVVART